MIAAILRAQWLSMRSFSMGSRRSATAVSALIGFVFYGFWVLGAVAIGAFLATSQDATWLPILIPVALLTVMMYWQIAPVISASLGASLDLKKLLVYPIPHEKLFQVEVLLRLTACVEMLIIITGMGIGLMRNSLFGGILSVPRILLVTFLFIVLNLLIAAGLRNLMERLLLKRRLREVMVVLLILVSVLPQLLLASKVNPEAMKLLPRGIIANPNCSTMQMLVALAPIHREVGIERINVATYQSVSGGGRSAMEELDRQTTSLVGHGPADPQRFPVQIAFNLIPHIDDFQDNGYTKEEMKLVWETRKILGDESIQVNPTAVRVPVFLGHSEAVHIETRRKISAADARALLEKAPGVVVVDQRQAGGYPTPVTHAAGKDPVFVGRIREDISHPRGLNLWVVSDNIRKGAALNAVQIAELWLKNRA